MSSTTPSQGLLGSTALSANTASILTYVVQSNNRTLYLNGTTSNSDSPTGGTSTYANVGRLGDDTSNNQFWNGQMAEILVYNRALSSAELTTVHRYLGARYAVSVP